MSYTIQRCGLEYTLSFCHPWLVDTFWKKHISFCVSYCKTQVYRFLLDFPAWLLSETNIDCSRCNKSDNTDMKVSEKKTKIKFKAFVLQHLHTFLGDFSVLVLAGFTSSSSSSSLWGQNHNKFVRNEIVPNCMFTLESTNATEVIKNFIS